MGRSSFKKFTIILMVFILLFDSFFGTSVAVGGGIQQPTAATKSIESSTDGLQNVQLPSPTPSPLPDEYIEVQPESTFVPALEPTPTPMAESFDVPSVSEENEPAQSRSSLRASEDVPAEGYDVMSEPEVKSLYEKYTELFGDKQVLLEQEQIEKLFEAGTSISDVYAIAFLHAIYNLDPLILWEMKQKSKENWLGLDQKLSEEDQKITSPTVAEDVYGEETLSRVSTVTESVYVEESLEELDQPIAKYNAIVTLSSSIDDAMSQIGLKDKYQTFNQQFSDQNNSSETINPITGMLTWRSNQISLPGRDGLDLNLGVIFQSNMTSQFYPGRYSDSTGKTFNEGIWDNNQWDNFLGLGWSFNIPSISSYNSYNDGKGGTYELEFVNQGENSYYRLKDYPVGEVKITTPGSSFLVQFPDKSTERYYSDTMVQTDRFGNKITYTYDSKRNISSIEDTLGRTITFAYKLYVTGSTSTGPNVTVRVFENNVKVKEVNYFQQSLGFNGATGLNRIEVTNEEKIQFEYAEYTQEFDFLSKSVPNSKSVHFEEYMLKKVQYNNSSQSVYDYEYGYHNLSQYGVIKKSRVSGRSDLILRNSLPSYVMNHNVISYSGDYSAYGVGSDPEKVPEGYHFSSTVGSVNQNNVLQQTTTTTFNHLKQQESVETRVASGSQTGQRVLTLYSNFLTNYKFTPSLIEQRIYDGDGDTNPNSLYTELTYNNLGYTLTETLPIPSEKLNNVAIKQKFTRSYQYDPSFKLPKVISWYANENDNTPLSESVSYTADGRIERNENALGEVTLFTYGKDSNAFTVTAEKWAGSQRTAKTVTIYGSTYNFAYPTEQQQWFNIGQPNQQIVTTWKSYDRASGLLLSETNGNQQTTSYVYDALGRLLKITKPEFSNSNGTRYSETEEYIYKDNQISTNFDSVNAGTYSFVVDTIHTLTQIANGSTMKTYGIQFYNGLGQTLLDERYDPNAGRYTQTQYHYDEWNRPVYVIDAASNTLSASYDAWGRQNRATNANEDLIVSEYSIKARTSTSYIQDKTTHEILNYAEQSFDVWGNKISASTYKDWPANGQKITESYRYNIMGNMTGYTDPNRKLNEDGVTATYTYDSLGRLSALKDALNQTTAYSYDGNGQLSKVTIQAKNGSPQTLNTKTYNELGLLAVKQDGASQSESYTYNSLGQLTAKTDRNGSSYGYLYDESGRLKKSTISGTINNVTQTQETNVIFGDGSASNQTLQTLKNNVITATQTQTQDSLGRVRSYSALSGNHSASIGNQLDIIGRVKQISDNYMGFYTNYQYTKQRLDKVQTNGSSTMTSAASANVQYSYFANDLVKSIAYPALTDGSVLKTEYTYNKALGWTESVKNTKGSEVLSGYSYGYDNNGNRVRVSEIRKGSSSEQVTNYDYDALNRLVSINRPDGTQTTYTYDVRGNRQTASDTSSVNQDLADSSYTYDLQNTLTSVTKGGNTTSFKYYADSLRSIKTKGNTETQVNYNFQGQVISEEKIVSGVFVEQANFVRGDRVLVKKDKKASKDYYYLYNGHGDVVQIVDTNGVIKNNYVYDEWGNITSQTEEISNSFKYAGETYDPETGLYYLRARYYDPSMGRFLNEDTVEGQIDNPLTQNLYTYVGNNPLIFSDPSGHSMESDHVLTQQVLNQLAPLTAGWEDLQRQLLSLDNSSASNITRMNIIALQTTIHRAAQNIRFNYFSTIENPTQTQIDAASSAGYIFGKNVDLSAGYKGRVDAQNDGSGTQRHGHIFGPKGEEWSRNLDGTIHDANRNSPGSPPKWVQKEMEKKTRFKWNEVNSTPPTSSINPGNIETGLYVVGGGYLAYRGIRLLPSLIPILWPTLPANLIAP
ncbi:RHS repeat protein [Paenibacillus sp. LMG 31459]|uniref:RHS repeat protein n=1 Tax=Paenibacillus phytohabitans TaxID=2654978 RepID=A0ABX1YE47_9BACL|nr:RHS repeat-associated core domain-containing protein [Paenibacillus phytohabitans]NOU78471.1 RHS repeat protein [Paenibacillus phytohabitans]